MVCSRSIRSAHTDYICRMTGSIILSSVYGYEASHPHDSLINITETAISRLCEAAIASSMFVTCLKNAVLIIIFRFLR